MDVTCERCGTEYEFDETLVGDRGTIVKCTNCGYVFRVARADATVAGESAWSIRCADGRTMTLASIGDLQQRIARGELSETDEISREDDQWKPLGSIAELKPYFLDSAATAVGRPSYANTVQSSPFKMEVPFSKAPSSPPHKRSSGGPIQNPTSLRPSQPGTVQSPPTSATETVASGSARTRRSTIAAWGGVTSSSAPPPPDGSATTLAANGHTSAPPAAKTPSSQPPAPAPAPANRSLYVDEEDESAWPKAAPPKSRTGLWMFVGLLVLAGAAAAAVFFYPPLRTAVGLTAPEGAMEPILRAGNEALALDDEAGYVEAERKFTEGVDLDRNDVRPVASLALTYAAWAQSLAFDASDLEARAAKDPSLADQAASLRRRVKEKAALALKFADTAVGLAPSNTVALLAKADALRLSGDTAGAKTQLTRAARLQDELSSDHHRIAGLVDIAENDGDLTVARAEAERAVDQDQSSVRARLFLARVYIAKGDVSEARNQLSEILANAPAHTGARKLTEALDKGLPPAPPVIAVVDAGTPPAAPTATDEAVPAEAAAATTPSVGTNAPSTPKGDATAATLAAAGRISAADAAPRDYSGYIEAGDKALDSDDLARAEEHFRTALGLRATGSEALTGLGYVALARQNYAEALTRFQPAMRNGYADAYIGLGDTYRRLDRLDDALAAYQGYLMRLPGGPSAGIAQRQIEAINARRAAATPPEPTPAPNTTNPYNTPSNAEDKPKFEEFPP